MASAIWVGTDEGLHVVGDEERVDLRGHKVGALVSDGDSVWALVGGYTVYRTGSSGIWRMVTRLAGRRSKLPRQTAPPAGTCMYVDKEGQLLVGTTGAHLLRFSDDDPDPERVEAFDRVAGRSTWNTPWGDLPDVRSITGDGHGTTYVNVHVGGIPKSSDGGDTWVPTIDIEADVHQVIALPDSSRLLAATARGLAISEDGGMRWTYRIEGLPASYCRAVAVTGENVLVTASEGPGGEKAGVYSAPLDGGAFERCKRGLPKEFDDNIDTHCLVAAKDSVAFGTSDGAVYVSHDCGYSWHEEATGLPPVRSLLIH
ncbi:MAG TPA: hypothetical protein VI076_11695 [Actinopolymorphaceae bacterium]